MGASISQMDPAQVHEFRKLGETSTTLDVPTKFENRHVTDKKGYIFFGTALLLLLPFLIFAYVKSDIKRLTHGMDHCGNICGVKNAKIQGIPCSGLDYTDKPLQFTNYGVGKEECVATCPPGFTEDFGICVRYGKLENTEVNRTLNELMWRDISSSSWKFLVMVLISLLASVLVLGLIRTIPCVVVWSILTTSAVLLVALTLFSWLLFNANSVPFVVPFLITCFTAIILLLLSCMIKRVGLVILLFKEASRALFSMPFIVLVPLLSVGVQLLVIIAGIVSLLVISNAGTLTMVGNDNYELKKNWAIYAAIGFSVIVKVWFLQFLSGCQYMITSGSVSAWFFARNSLYLTAPIWSSVKNTLRFHLGTVLLGSFIITIVALLRVILRILINNKILKCVVDCICSTLESILRFLTNNAYIETAIHGESFFKSGKRAARLLLDNVSSVAAVNFVGNFILGMIQIFIILSSTGISYYVFQGSYTIEVSMSICFIIVALVVYFIFSIFQATIDTLIICFCEDQSLNDGETKPFLMSKDLMICMEKSKEVYDSKKGCCK